MTISSKYAAILGNLTRDAPQDIDPVLFGEGPKKGRNLAFVEDRAEVSADLWSRADDDRSYIGIRVTGPVADQHAVAADLAAVAVERQIIPVFLSWVGACGMQRFGFRVELIGGADETEMQACEEQVSRMWNLAIIVDAADIASFD
jgi:hypothetical protein